MPIKCPKCHFENPDDTIYCGKCATPLKSAEGISAPTETLVTPREELATGSTFAGRYQIIEELGKGGMGKVYKTHDTKIKEKIALKLIKPEIAKDKKTIERFSNELRLARKIRHKNVCGMFDLGEEKGTHYITMEFVPGEDLRSLIKRIGQLPIGKSISITKQICDGLAEAHRLGVVHRDLKSNNIMIDKEGNVRIMDFGIARSLQAKGITGAGVMIGTPEYMSPEQVEGKESDHRSDIYSLGISLYEMVTGRVPFEGDTPFTIGVKQKSEAPRNPKELNSQIPDDLSNLILKCMEKEKEKRYQSVGEVRSELENIEKGIPTAEKVIQKRKPITSKEITVTFGLKKIFIPALVVVAMGIASLIIWQPWSQKKAALIPTDKPSLAVMYFENDTGDENLDHWRKALAELLIADLMQSKYIDVLSGDRLFNLLRQLNLLEAKSYSSEDLQEIAVKGGANHILRGNYTKAGDSFRINAMIQNVSTSDLIGSERVEGEGEKSFFSMVDELTRRIKTYFKLSEEQIASDIDREVGMITTSSPEAYNYYIEGIQYFMWGDFRKCIQFLEKAVSIDPEFVMAYRKMAAAYNNLGYYDEGKKYTHKAFEFKDRVSDRERFIIEGELYRLSERTYDKAIEAYENVLQIYPGDITANSNLGWVYIFLEEWDKAIEHLNMNYIRAIQTKSESPISTGNLSAAYMAKGLYDKATEVLEEYLSQVAENPIVLSYLTRCYLHQGKYNSALATANKAFSLNPKDPEIIYRYGDIFYLKGDLEKAEKEYKKLLKVEEKTLHLWGRDRLGALNLSKGKFAGAKKEAAEGIKLAEKLGEKRWETEFHLNLVYMHLNSGQSEQALEECDKTMRSANEIDNFILQRDAQYFKGLTLLELGALDEAQRAANELKEFIEKGMNRKAIRYYHHLMGRIQLKREKFSKAIEDFEKAMSLLANQFYPPFDHHALFYEPLALAFYISGNLDKAEEQYKKIISLTTGRIFYGDIYAKSYYMLGKIFEQKGWKGKAIEHYEKFLNFWKDADPGIAEVEDAKKRLAGLKNQ